MKGKDFDKTVLKLVSPESRILDLGAGRGCWAEEFAIRGASVVAVDRILPEIRHPMISWEQRTVEEYISQDLKNKAYDIIFLRNIIQFLNKQWVFQSLFPALSSHLTSNGFIAIQTFFWDCIPHSDKPVLSLYRTKDLLLHFQGWKIILAQQFDTDRTDMSKNLRHFYLTDLIAQKNNIHH